MKKLFTTFSIEYGTTAEAFVSFWSKQYSYKNEHLYNENIELLHHTYDTLNQLFQWKNGMVLSEKKRKSFEKIVAELEIINRFRKNGVEINEFEGKFGWLSSIWKIFLLHILEPRTYPIFDQHVYRAYRYVHEMEKQELDIPQVDKEEIYYKNYLPFYMDMQDLCKQQHTNKQIDEALWSFGKFLSQYPGMLL